MNSMSFSDSILYSKHAFTRGIFLFFFFLFISNVLSAQNSYNFYGKGARAAGMGYAFNAISDDAFAMSWNPAGMTQIKKLEFAFARSMKITNYTHAIHTELDYKPVFNLDYLGLVYPIKLKKRNLVLGLNYQTLLNYKENYSRGNKSELSEVTNRNYLTVNTISLCGAYPVTRYLSLGVSLNAWFSLGNKANYYTYYNSKLIYDGEREDENYNYEHNTYRYSGVDMSAGFFTDFTAFNFPLRFAFNWRSESIIKNEYSSTYESVYIYEMAEDTTKTEIFDGPKKYYYHRMFQMGISYRIGEYLTLACDFDYRPFKNSVFSWDYYHYNDFHTPVIDTTKKEVFYISQSNANLHQVRIGAEYILHPDFALIPIRIGWKNNPTTLSDYNENEEPVKQVYASSFTMGVGWVMKYFTIDFAYEWYSYERMDANYNYEKRTDYLFVLSMIIHL